MSNEQTPTAPSPLTPHANAPAHASTATVTPALAVTQTPASLVATQSEPHANLQTRIAYFAIGGAIGAIVALLFAPKPGRELRTDLADATRKGVDRTRETAHTIGTKAGEYYEVSKERAAELYTTASHKAGDVAGAAREHAARRGEQLSAAIEAGKQAYAEEKRRADDFAAIEAAPTYYEADKHDADKSST